MLDDAARFWRIAPRIAAALTTVGTLTGALVHGEVQVWHVAYYLGQAVFIGVGCAAVPASILADIVGSFVNADDDILWVGSMLVIGGFFTVALAGVWGPNDIDTLGRVVFSAIGIAGLGYALYRADQAKSEERGTRGAG